MNLSKKLLFAAILAPLLGRPTGHAAEFEVLDRFSVDGYSVLKGSADIPGGSFTVGGSTFVVKGGNVGIGIADPFSKLSFGNSSVSNKIALYELATGNALRGDRHDIQWDGLGHRIMGDTNRYPADNIERRLVSAGWRQYRYRDGGSDR